MTRALTLLGSTGSIGRSTLDVAARHPDRFRVVALAAHTQWERLLEQCRQFSPAYAALADSRAAAQLSRAAKAEGLSTQVLAGEEGLVHLASLPEVDTVLAAIVGAAGLQSTLAAARSGKRILLANKEALVMSGQLFIDAAARGGAAILPIDSEHNAIFQCLPPAHCKPPAGVRRILLTASGGPFRTVDPERLTAVTPDEACAHPNWRMGRKISVDSATMMNKGLEVIEAHWLFGLPAERIEVVIHPQSVIHSLVEYEDGSVLAQLGNPDMRTPIAHALAHPDRVQAGVSPLDLVRVGTLSFEAPDPRRFPCLRLAYGALDRAGSAPAALNAANEVAVEAFLQGRLGFTQIARICGEVMERHTPARVETVDAVIAVDAEARALARQCLASAGRISGSFL
jgi:1-deoxy-D-xylulose-5-phosphate reductoisomerase